MLVLKGSNLPYESTRWYGINLLGHAKDFKMVKCHKERDQSEKGESNPFVQNVSGF